MFNSKFIQLDRKQLRHNDFDRIDKSDRTTKKHGSVCKHNRPNDFKIVRLKLSNTLVSLEYLVDSRQQILPQITESQYNSNSFHSSSKLPLAPTETRLAKRSPIVRPLNEHHLRAIIKGFSPKYMSLRLRFSYKRVRKYSLRRSFKITSGVMQSNMRDQQIQSRHCATHEINQKSSLNRPVHRFDSQCYSRLLAALMSGKRCASDCGASFISRHAARSTPNIKRFRLYFRSSC